MKSVALLMLSLFSVSLFSSEVSISRSVEIRTPHLPLYNCDLYSDSRDFKDCEFLSDHLSFETDRSFEGGGYAVACRSFRDRFERRVCEDIYSKLTDSPRSVLDCRRARGLSEQRRCEMTIDGYRNGRFESTYQERRPVREVRQYDDRSSIRNSEFDQRVCYQNAYDAWLQQKQKQERQGAIVAGTGLGIAILGNVIGAISGNKEIGEASTDVGAEVMIVGLVEISLAGATPPYQIDGCRQYYTPSQPRMVMIEQQRCYTTKYESHSWNGYYYYYETKCSSRMYYSFEDNSRIW